MTKSKKTVADFPNLVDQWHPDKNAGITPDRVSASSHKKIWWTCPKGPDHEWEAIVKSRTTGSGCPCCDGKKLSVTNSFVILHPDIAAQFHSIKNEGFAVDQIITGSHKNFWWKCSKSPDHEWEATVKNRTKPKGTGCPCCAGLKISITNSLVSLHPDIALQFHPIKNGELTPDMIVANSDKKVWWKCPNGPDHEWPAVVYDRTSAGKTGCPFCARQKLSVTNSLATLYPSIASEFLATKNNGLTADKILAGSHKKCWWKCPKGPDHEWEVAVISRTSSKSGCPYCTGLKLSVTNSLAARYPDIASELHPTKNNGLSADKILAGTIKKYWWKCSKGPDHEWEATVDSRTSGGRSCACCSGRQVSVTNSLATRYPNIASEFHPTKNGGLSPEQMIAGSNKKYWWKCLKNPDHEWKATVGSRTCSGTGCPQCNCGWTVDAIRNFIKSLINHIDSFTPAELYTIFQQAGILKSTGIAKNFVKAVSTGRFPPDELKKFANEEDSTVNRFISGEITSLENNPNFSDSNDIVVADTTVDLEKSKVDSLLTDLSLPIVSTNESLKAIDAAIRFVSMDAEAIGFLLASATAKIWQDAFQNEERAREQAIAFKGSEYAECVRDKFLAELSEASNLKLPSSYSFRPGGKLVFPNLMQRLVASQLKTKCSLGNWSGTGAGKTLSAVLASRSIDARLTIICCPNAVVGGSSQTGHGWADEICDIFPDSEVQTKTFTPVWQKQIPHRYLVLNYELFQKPDSPSSIRDLLTGEQIDMIIIDEVHYAKQRTTENMSRRRELITALIATARERNPNLRVLGLSATPIINNLQEGKSLLEMITGVQYPELETRATVANCHKLHQQLVLHGFRWRPNYCMGFEEERIYVDCSEYVQKIRALGAKGSPHSLEQILTEARLPVIREQCLPGKKTLIYTYYTSNIIERIVSTLREDGHRVGLYTGDDKTGLESFLKGDLNVLIGSSAIGTGVDGLQRVCDRMIVNILPWTNAEYEQLKGRILRQGQQSDLVKIILPVTYANIGDMRWSWEESKLDRIQWKKSVADAAVDGVIPEGHLRTPEQAYCDLMDWLERLSTGSVNVLERPAVVTCPLEDNPMDVTNRLAQYGDFSKMNRRWNHSLSNNTHDRLKSNPEEWYHYHSLYRSARESWVIIPYEEMINWCRERNGHNYKIGDFGCGEAKLAEAVSDIHTIHSFDHIAINSNVTACDIAAVPIDEETLDVALFSLSLMGENFADYIKEAHRTLRLDGHLIIFEPTSRFIDDTGVNHASKFAKDLERFGFSSGMVEMMGPFTRIQAIKRSRILAMNSRNISFKG